MYCFKTFLDYFRSIWTV